MVSAGTLAAYGVEGSHSDDRRRPGTRQGTKRPRTTCQWLARVRIRLRANLTTAASHYTLIAGRYEVSGEQQQQRVGSFTRSRYRPHQNRRFRHPDPDLDPGPPALGPRRPGP